MHRFNPIFLTVAILLITFAAYSTQSAAQTGLAVSEVGTKKACPITKSTRPRFIPPEPYSEWGPQASFWYGTEDLWTAYPTNGQHGQKVLWWSKHFDVGKEPYPALTVTGRRLDGDAPTFETTWATNGYHPDLGSFMLIGLDIPTFGCWELTGHYKGFELSFVIWIAP